MSIKISVSPLCAKVLDFFDINNYSIINPYNLSLENKKLIHDSNLLILVRGYKKKVLPFFYGEIIEFKTVTIDDLIYDI